MAHLNVNIDKEGVHTALMEGVRQGALLRAPCRSEILWPAHARKQMALTGLALVERVISQQGIWFPSEINSAYCSATFSPRPPMSPSAVPVHPAQITLHWPAAVGLQIPSPLSRDPCRCCPWQSLTCIATLRVLCTYRTCSHHHGAQAAAPSAGNLSASARAVPLSS